mmetsp:Transcript_26989/g.25843  ORF Transcript_26989/g.25843 Transcript_26989/m.25843 type:complete len:329 (-) Transcript_26989:357-1343(-)
MLSFFIFSLSTFQVACSETIEYNSVSANTLLSTHGLHLPRLGLGTAGLGGNDEEITLTALNFGVKLVDTAQAPEWYNERGVGKGIQRYRSQFLSPKNDSVVILTKIHPRSYEEKKMEASITESKKLLNGDENIPIDIVLLHTPYCWSGHCSKEEESVSWQVGWRNLEYSMQAGNILSIGVSNFDIGLLKELLNMADLKVSVIQNWMDPFHQDLEVRKYAAQYSIVYMGYSSFGTQWQGKYNGDNPVFSNKLLQGIAEKHGTSVSGVVLSWLLQENVVAIPRASSYDHIRENAAPIANGPDKDNLQVFLDKDDIEAIRSLDGTLGTPWE